MEETLPHGDSVLMRFSGVQSPEAAKALKGAEIIAGRESAAPLKEGEFYIEDLKGLAVTGGNGETLGHITDILEGGGGYLVEIELSDGRKRLAPFRNEFFADVLLDEGKIALLETWVLE